MALIYPQNGDLTKLLKSARKKVPQSARLSAGGGGQKLKGQCPNAPSMNLSGASLISIELIKLVNFRPMLSNNLNFAFQIKLLRPQEKVDFFVIFVLFLPLQKTNEP